MAQRLGGKLALLDEEVVEYWLTNNGFFCMGGHKVGTKGVIILAHEIAKY